MNTIIFQTIRTVAVFGTLFFFSVDIAFAAPALSPVSAREITSTSAVITGYVSNPYKNSTVWFDLYDGGEIPTSVAIQGIWHGGSFEWDMTGLKPGTRYSYRSAAMEGGETVYSSISSFTTPTLKTAAPATTFYQAQPQTTTYTKPVETVSQKTQTVAKKQTVAVSQTYQDGFDNRKSSSQQMDTREGFTNNNSAQVLGTGDGIFPTTLIGWMLLVIAILVMVLMISVIMEPTKKHNKDEEHPGKAVLE